jgi:hypothetical protein
MSRTELITLLDQLADEADRRNQQGQFPIEHYRNTLAAVEAIRRELLPYVS